MATAQRPLSRWKFVLPDDRAKPRAEQTVWHLRHLTAAQEARTYDDLDSDASGKLIRRNLGSSWHRILKAGLVDVENFRDGDGAEVKFEHDASGEVSDAFLLKLTMSDRTTIAIAIQNEIVWDPDAVGKSELPST